MTEQVRLSKEHKEFIDDIAEQLHTSRKDVMEHIIDWFQSQGWEEDPEEEEEDFEEEEEDEED